MLTYECVNKTLCSHIFIFVRYVLVAATEVRIASFTQSNQGYHHIRLISKLYALALSYLLAIFDGVIQHFAVAFRKTKNVVNG